MQGTCPRPVSRRGTVVVVTAIFTVALIAFAALAIDMGTIYLARVELQRTADAAAMAAVNKIDYDFAGARSGGTDAVRNEAAHFAGLNPVLGETLTLNPTTDVITGVFDLATGVFQPD